MRKNRFFTQEKHCRYRYESVFSKAEKVSVT
jgi:hypothetical protein